MNNIKIICLAVILLESVICLRKSRDYANPTFIYSFFWFSLLGGYSLRLFGLYNTSNRPYVYILIGCISFYLGSKVATNRKIKNIYNYKYNEILIDCLFVVAFLVFLRKDIWSIVYILKGETIRNIRYNNLVPSVYIEDLLVKFWARPLCVMLTAIGLGELITNEKKYRKHMILALVLMIQSFLFDGILVLFECLIANIIVVLLILSSKRIIEFNLQTIDKKKKKAIGLLGIGLLGLYVAKKSILKTVYMHFAPSIIFLDQRLQCIDNGRITNPIMRYTYGFSTLQGIIRPFAAVIEKLLGHDIALFESATRFLLDNHDYVIYVADGEYYNFYVTPFAFYYKDLGLVGVILFPFLFSIICTIIYNKMKCNNNSYSYALYIFLVSGVFSMVKYAFFAYTEMILALWWFLICTKKCRINKDNN